jgi:phosphoglycerate dehydrogenase-like enzyme
VCLLPLTADTENILNRETLGRLLHGGYVINVARGGHLVEADLLALLDGGQLAGAALDVFRDRTAARRPPVLDPPEDHGHPAHLGAHAARGKHRPDRGQDPRAGTGRTHRRRG